MIWNLDLASTRSTDHWPFDQGDHGDEDDQWYQSEEGEVGEEDDQGHPGDEVDKGWQGQGDEDDRGDMVMRAGEFKMTFRKIIILIKKLLKF